MTECLSMANRALLDEYGFVNATAHPVIGTPPITDPPNDKEWATAGPWHYLPGYLSPSFVSTTGRAQGPLRLYRGSSEHEMMQDMMIHALGHAPPLRYQAIQVKRIGVRHVEGGPRTPRMLSSERPAWISTTFWGPTVGFMTVPCGFTALSSLNGPSGTAGVAACSSATGRSMTEAPRAQDSQEE